MLNRARFYVCSLTNTGMSARLRPECPVTMAANCEQFDHRLNQAAIPELLDVLAD